MTRSTAHTRALVAIFTIALFFRSIPSSYADIFIAAVGPMTGQFASLGQQIKEGTQQAVDDINAKGGINGEKVRLLVGDDACDPKQAVAVANQLAAKKISLVVGHLCSGSSIPASSVYHEEKVVQITPASTSPKFTEERPGKGIFRIAGRDDYQGLESGTFIAEHFPNARVAILHDKTSYGKGLADETKKYMNQAGKKEFMYAAFNAGEKDYTALVSRLRKDKIELLYLGGYHTEIAMIVRELKAQNMRTVVIGGDSLVTDSFWAIAGSAGNGVLMTYLPDPRKNPDAMPIVQRFYENGILPRVFTIYSYATMQVWAQAAERAGTTDYDKIVEVLATGEFDTVLGKISFDENGDIRQMEYAIYEWRDGEYDYHKPAQE